MTFVVNAGGTEMPPDPRGPITDAGRRPGPATIAATAIAALIRQWRHLVLVPLAAGIITTGIVLVVTPRFESSFSIVPASPGQSLQIPIPGGGAGGGLAAIAQGLGFGSVLGTGTPLEYFSDLVTSRRVTDAVLRTPLPPGIVAMDSATDLIDLFNIHTGDSRKDLDAGYKAFAKVVKVTTDPQSGIMTVTASGKTPAIAVVVAHLLLTQLEAANSSIQRGYAEQQAIFLQHQTDDARKHLTDAEDALLQFYEANRTFQSSPALSFQESRLHRQVDMAQSLYLTLAQELQQEQFTASRDTPVFSIIDGPTVPGLRAFPQRSRSVILAVFLCGFAMTGLVLLQTFYIGNPEDRSQGMMTLRAALRSVRSLRRSRKASGKAL